MPSFDRILEVFFYSLLNFLPFMVLALYPFRDRLRFGRTGILLLIFLLTLLQAGLGMTAAFGSGSKALLSGISTIIYGVFYFTAVKAPLGKTLFTLLMLSNIANFVVTTSKCAEGLIFGEFLARQSYRWSYCVCMLIITLITAIPLFYYFRSYYADGINKQIGAPAWNYLWLIPATFYLLWFWHNYNNEKSALEIALMPSSALFLFFINLGAFLVYHTVIRLINEQEKNQTLAFRNHQLTIQNLQYENLSIRMNEARQARHDIRHHVAVLDSYLNAGEYEKLREYLQSYKKTLPSDRAMIFCSHYTINTLLLYFAQQAEDHHIDFSVSAKLPAQVGIPDNILSVLLGNLLENALEACLAFQDGPAGISVKARSESDALFFQIDNSCGKKPVCDKEGYYLSSKHKGRGIGLMSVRNIVAQYDGLLEINQDQDRFCVSVLLNIP